MFDIVGDEIAELNDEDLRSLVARLCEAEVSARGLSPASVTWGGNQTAADGGLDVRVALPVGPHISGFIPRVSTGFQVKKPDMPRKEIIAEMRPAGTIRPVIQQLANEGGAYIIVSSSGSTADSALRNRNDALREALIGVVNGSQIHTDFYDRTRLATWVRCHPGLITWVKEKIGRSITGWRSYGPWSGSTESADADYLLDDKLRLHLGNHRDAPAKSVSQAIDEIRDELSQPKKIVRLVGLSGVGKTRLVQALFDARIGSRALPPSLAVYTNLSDNPEPQPAGLASDLIANRTRAVLIVDNCPPELHRRLSELCTTTNSTVSVVTVEYDVRDDQPEGTQVVTLETSSPNLIERLVQRRYSHLSQVDVSTIAAVSGGNARIAIALAETVERSETIAGLSNEELFQRLFRQRHDADNALLLAAQACSLVYSFQGEALTGEKAELPLLASLVGLTPTEIYRHVGELRRRDLVQQRGVWRAVLPHAIANRLAARALADTPYHVINHLLVGDGTHRLAQSFSRRLSFLHEHPKAVAIVEEWLAADGLLGDVTALDELKQAMFENIAPVLPKAALSVLERAGNGDPQKAVTAWHRHRALLRSIAFDPDLFESSIDLLVRAATNNPEGREVKEASETFVSLFPIHFSGTHATIEQRLRVIERLIISNETQPRSLGFAALNAVLEATHFRTSYRFDFGARSRNHGYRPRKEDDVTRWYSAALALIERLALIDMLKPELCAQLAQNFQGLWTSAHMFSGLEALSRKFAADGFWREGWAACRRTMHFDRDRLTPNAVSRLSLLEAELRPSNLPERVRAVVLGDRSGRLDLEEIDADDVANAFERSEAAARDLGAAVVLDDAVFAELLPDLLRGGNRVWAFGRGLARASIDLRGTWEKLVRALEKISSEQQNVQVMRGFLAEAWERERELTQTLLDLALEDHSLVHYIPLFQTAVELDERGAERLKQALKSDTISIWMYRNLSAGRVTDTLSGHTLGELLVLISHKPDGFGVAIDILFMRLYSDNLAKREHEPALLDAGRKLLEGITFRKDNQDDSHHLADIVKACLVNLDGGPLAASVVSKLKHAVATYETYSFNNKFLLKALLEVQPKATLDALFCDNENDQREGIAVFGHSDEHHADIADSISCEALIEWCEQDPEKRYLFAATFVKFAQRLEENGPQTWSEQAMALLTNAPNIKEVLMIFVDRLRPMSWSGSRAALMEMNVKLLDDLEKNIGLEFMQMVSEAKIQLLKEVKRERYRESQRDRDRDEKFE